jgi:hypothetical protein
MIADYRSYKEKFDTLDAAKKHEASTSAAKNSRHADFANQDKLRNKALADDKNGLMLLLCE